MARKIAELPKGSRITDYISLGVIAKTFPLATVKSVLDATGLMHEAALKADEDPDRLSFLHAVRVIRRKLPIFPTIPPRGEGGVP